MERLPPVLPGRSPFLTRSIVYLCEDWYCTNDHAEQALGYLPRKDWRLAVNEQLRLLPFLLTRSSAGMTREFHARPRAASRLRRLFRLMF